MVKVWKVNTLKNTPVDDEIERFLLQCLFRGLDDTYGLSMNRAYLDLCRTLRIADKDKAEKARRGAEKDLRKEAHAILAAGCANQDQYDSWHFNICEKLVKRYKPSGCVLTLGHAQKWVNMTMKYLCVFKDVQAIAMLPYLHAPLDSYIFKAAKDQLGINPPCHAWSKLANYQDYIAYQAAIRDTSGKPALVWEFGAWNATASQK